MSEIMCNCTRVGFTFWWKSRNKSERVECWNILPKGIEKIGKICYNGIWRGMSNRG